VAARTRRTRNRLVCWALLPLSLALFCGDSRGSAEDASKEAEGAPKEGWRIEEAHVRFNYYDQKGFGYQSQAGPGVPGSERLYVY